MIQLYLLTLPALEIISTKKHPIHMKQDKNCVINIPVYLWTQLEYYLQMITPLPPKFEPGIRFGYSNAGFIMLGLAIEAASETPYQQFVMDEIIPFGIKAHRLLRAMGLVCIVLTATAIRRIMQ